MKGVGGVAVVVSVVALCIALLALIRPIPVQLPPTAPSTPKLTAIEKRLSLLENRVKELEKRSANKASSSVPQKGVPQHKSRRPQKSEEKPSYVTRQEFEHFLKERFEPLAKRIKPIEEKVRFFPKIRQRKRVSWDEWVRKLSLTPQQEAKLRVELEQLEKKIAKLMLGTDDLEEARRILEEAKQSEEKRNELMLKIGTRIAKNIPQLMEVKIREQKLLSEVLDEEQRAKARQYMTPSPSGLDWQAIMGGMRMEVVTPQKEKEK